MSVNVIKQSAESENLSLKPEVDTLLVELGVEPISYAGGALVAKTPITGETVAHVRERGGDSQRHQAPSPLRSGLSFRYTQREHAALSNITA